VIPQFSEKKLSFIFSFLSCSMALGFGVSGGIPQETVDLLAFFPLGRELKWESEFGPLISIRWMGAPPLSSPTLADPLSLSPICCTTPSLFLSSPRAVALYPLHDFLLPLDLPPRSKDREEEEHVELKRERGSRRCSSPSLLEDFLGENPRYG
jgi:hypothetical protein